MPTPLPIVGAGISGLTLSRALRHLNIPSTLYEKSPSPPPHNYAITLCPTSYTPLLPILGIDERAFRARVAVDRRDGSGEFRAHRGRLEELLREGVDVRWGCGVEAVVEGGEGGVKLRFSNGGNVQSNMVVGADGVHSALRTALMPGVHPAVLPFVAFNGRRRVSRELFQERYAPALRGANVLESSLGGVKLQVHVTDNPPPSPSAKPSASVGVSWIFSRASRGADDALYAPHRPKAGATETPPAFFAEVQSLQEGLEQPFADIFDVAKLRRERILSWLMRTVRVPVGELRAWGEKGVLFVGDAVHAQPILGGGGANAAIADGLKMAEFIAGRKDGDGGWAGWYDARYAEWERGVEGSERRIGEMHAKL
ncbi:FAD/NAD(P)-binding domain-containing protein [Dothidotthia symphoricarpi CBS 119687]|uniref:FAD/NAD(P)-binding domain-containing protein n=1 Tax=Dothidotthia symphoricarpi CBS 119687 TaxID=1392245 RepID=A0A6A6AGQ3_9PLEO|nr:FAD/NAD(P)-binding domain-containing protein [Dothidotthia symphoricarpi CBS 119687]KAF2130295.1 FAD/NAD(P)-binding domain-containing protein [Dothidotthia symphoricarpi CBS 119687]